MINQSKLLLILVSLCLGNLQKTVAQKTSEAYWDAYGIAKKYYNEADYINASKAFEEVWTKPNEDEMANHRLYAAAANCMIDNEEDVKKNLFKISAIANKTDMKRVLVNYEIFNKYKGTNWWVELETRMDNRLQELIDHHKNLRIFKKGRNFKYSAIRINKDGDTLANTFITFIPEGTGWGDEAADSQSEVIYSYEYSTQDSLDHIKELDSISHRKFWNGIDSTGIIENESEVWIHPIRNNEFFKTEVAPFPTVKYPISDETMQAYKPKIIIMNGWGTYSNTKTFEHYSYHGEMDRTYSFEPKLLCHKFSGIGKNTRHGESEIEYYFHEDYGFVEMNYLTYDGDIIKFKIVEIIE